MEIYIASFAGLLSSLLLAAVYLADRYEPEPIELIQGFFLSGLLGQLVLALAAGAALGSFAWEGPWLLITAALAAISLPFHLHRQPELDERFDGIVYSVSLMTGATCVIHLNNLPLVVAGSPHRAALAPGTTPDLRDMLIIATSPAFSTELGQTLVMIAVATLVGAVLGTQQLRGGRPSRTAVLCALVALAVVGLDLIAAGAWPARAALIIVSLSVALAIKRGSVFRSRPEPAERDALILGLKTVLIVLGAALLTTVLLRSTINRPAAPLAAPPEEAMDRQAENA